MRLANPSESAPISRVVPSNGPEIYVLTIIFPSRRTRFCRDCPFGTLFNASENNFSTARLSAALISIATKLDSASLSNSTVALSGTIATLAPLSVHRSSTRPAANRESQPCDVLFDCGVVASHTRAISSRCDRPGVGWAEDAPDSDADAQAMSAIIVALTSPRSLVFDFTLTCLLNLALYAPGVH